MCSSCFRKSLADHDHIPHYSHSATSTVDEPHNFPTETPLTITIVTIPIPSHHHCWSTTANTNTNANATNFFHHYHSHSFIHPNNNNNNKYISQLNRLIYHPSIFQRALTYYILYRRRRTNNKVQGKHFLLSIGCNSFVLHILIL